MARRKKSDAAYSLLVIVAVAMFILSSKVFWIALGIVAAVIIGVVIFIITKSKNSNEIQISGETAYFIAKARDSEAHSDYLKARVAYMKAMQTLKNQKAEQTVIDEVQKEYDAFVLRDPVYKYLMSKLLTIIEKENGILQSKISKEFEEASWVYLEQANREVTKDDIYYALYFAEKFGHIVRIKNGRSYNLYLPGTEPKEN